MNKRKGPIIKSPPITGSLTAKEFEKAVLKVLAKEKKKGGK